MTTTAKVHRDPSEQYRPPVAARVLAGRTDPGRIEVRTRFLYDMDGEPEPGESRHVFSQGSTVTESDWPPHYAHQQQVEDHIFRAIASFGDDTDLVITIARKGTSGN